MTKGAKIAIGIIVAIGIGAGVYFFLTRKKSAPNDYLGGVVPLPGTGNTPSSGGSGGGGSTTGTGKPTNVDTLAFQQYVINTKKDKTILGGGGPSGFGDDGVWGSKTQSAWNKYGADYLKSLQPGATAPVDQNKKNYSDSWYEQQADKLEVAMEGLGTDEDTIGNVFSKLKSNADYWELKKAFGTRSNADMVAWLKGDLYTWQLKKYCNDPMKANGLTVQIS
jgi:hypothetical protein